MENVKYLCSLFNAYNKFTDKFVLYLRWRKQAILQMRFFNDKQISGK